MSEHGELSRRGVRMTATAANRDQALPWIVFLHGLGGSRRDFRFLISGLADRFNCLAVDLPGHGESRPGSRPGLEALAEDLGSLLEDVPEAGTFSLVGHSMGGLLGIRVAEFLPQRVSALAVLDSNIPATHDGVVRNLAVLDSLDETERWQRYLLHMARSWGVPDGSAEEYEALQTAGQLSKTVATRLWSDIRRTDGPRPWREVRHPLLYVCSSREIGLKALQAANSLVTVSDLRDSNVGHWPHLRAPRLVLEELMPFLTRFSSG